MIKKKKNKNIKSLFYSKKIWRDLVETVREGVYISDVKGNIVYANQACVELLGYDNEKELLGRNLSKEIYLNPNDSKKFLKIIEVKGYVRNYELSLIKKNGDVILVSATSNSIRDANNKIACIEGVLRDITEQKRWEGELKQVQDILVLEKRKFEQVLDIDQNISSLIHLDHLVDFVVDHSTRLLEAKRCSLMLLDPKTQELLIRGAKGLNEKIIKESRIKLGEEISGYVGKSGKPLLITDIENNCYISRKNRNTYTSRSFLSIPIVLHNKVVGVVNVSEKCLSLKRYNVFNETDMKILKTIVRQAAIAIENASYYRELEFLSVNDALTGLYNHRYFTQRLEEEIGRLNRYKRPFCLMRIDIDNFKAYNDAYGPMQGDDLLKEIAKVLQARLRRVDIICRYSGDEFVTILPETDIKQGRLVAEKIKNDIQKLCPTDDITLGIGMSLCDGKKDRHDLILKSDQALYNAKKHGKNQIFCLH